MRILVTLDGSQLAERALAAMAPLLKSWGAETSLLTVLDPGEEHDTVDADRFLDLPRGYASSLALQGAPVKVQHRLVEDRGQALEAARIAAEEELIKQAEAYLEGVPWAAHVIFARDVPEAIASFVEANGISLVALSTHGRSGLGQAIFGSVASEVVRQLHVPAVIVGAQVTAEVRGIAHPAETLVEV